MEKSKEELLKEVNKSITAFVNDANINDIRLLSIIMHLYLESYMNNIISSKLKHPERIIDRLPFYRKCTLLDAFGIFDENINLKNNINKINKIRNHYAHNLESPIDEEIPTKVVDLISQMRPLDKDRLEKDTYNTVMKFRLLSIETISKLSQISENG